MSSITKSIKSLFLREKNKQTKKLHLERGGLSFTKIRKQSNFQKRCIRNYVQIC